MGVPIVDVPSERLHGGETQVRRTSTGETAVFYAWVTPASVRVHPDGEGRAATWPAVDVEVVE